ncbi:MAG TPA: PIG-L deacetylase family protein [Verrucomicrobiae bacterium]|nr:PIG-L deacetylase family protein [Verrucomicrobiae bacterium]
MPTVSTSVAFAIAAHPDDIEFYMAGTLLRLKEKGWSIHYMTLSSGSCGSTRFNAATVRRIRRKESKAAAKLLGAQYHDSIADDLEILYELPLLRKLAATVRKVQPRIVLTHSPQDYMEDHTNTCRLAVTAAFARGMPNFKTTPPARAIDGDVTIYHAMPHGLRDPLRQPVLPDCFIDTTSVHGTKREALAAHRSQKEWLDASQGMDSYLQTMDALSLDLGFMSGRFQHAEGWRRHLHLGFSAAADDPLHEALKDKYLCRES